MKSINAKKIAAVTAGAVLIGASLLAAAPIMYGNTEVVNAQGKPVVKVVVGANAHASDGVAAANIAAVIGSMAYKSQTVSAQLTGSPTCNVSAGGSAGACSVSDKKVTLEITTPGTAVAAGAYGFRTFGYGFIDDNTTTEDNQLGDGNAKKITGDNFVSFQDAKSSVSAVSGSFTTKQEMYVKASQAATYFDDVKKYKIVPSNLYYVIKFEHDTFGGIPACSLSSVYSATVAMTMANCTPSDTYRMDRQRLKIKYLGEDWIISEMNPDAATTSIKLAKESTPASIVYAGQNVSAGAYTVKLADLTIPYGAVDSQAVLQIFDANKQLVKEDTVTTSASKEITLPNGDKITIRVFKTAPGLTTAKWAEMSVFSQELELTNGQTVDSDANKNWTVNLGWKNHSSTALNKFTLANITLTRQSLDYVAEGDSVNAIESPALFQLNFAGSTLTDAQRDTLKIDYTRISSFYDNESSTSSISDQLRDYVCFTSAKKAFQFSNAPVSSDDRYKVCVGLGNDSALLYDKPDKGYVRWVPQGTLTNTTFNLGVTNVTGGAGGNYSALVFDGTTWQNSTQSAAASAVDQLNLTQVYKSADRWGSPLNNVTYNFRLGPYENASSLYLVGSSNATNVTSLAGYYAIVNGNNIAIVNGSAYMPATLPYPFDVANVTLGYNIQDNTAENSNITLTDATVFASGVVGNETITISEFLNKGGVTSTSGLAVKYGTFSFVADPSSQKFIASTTDTSESKLTVGYLSPSGGASTGTREVGFMSQRGSKIDARSSSTVTLKMAKKLGELQFYLKSSGTNISGGTSTSTMAEGQQVTVQDSTVKVKEISQTVGACSVSGGSSGCTADKGAMKAVLDVAGAPSSAEFSMPYQFSATERLVVLDSEAPTAESLILVGGQLVNTVTARTISGTDVKIDKPGVKVVKAVSDQRIVVAGYNAEDTTAAASQFISELLAKVA
ncbi:Uncharacterised protein [uncultured archaeon]|nr:Uncharacterised protein [uncultured archaeon]